MDTLAQRKRTRLQRWWPEGMAALFIILFLYTGLEKLKDLKGFQLAMERSTPLQPYARFLSFTVPIVELALCALLFFPRTRFYGLLSSTLLMLTFTIYVGSMIVSARELPCTCGGIIQQLTWREHLAVNSCFSFAGIISIVLHRKKQSTK